MKRIMYPVITTFFYIAEFHSVQWANTYTAFTLSNTLPASSFSSYVFLPISRHHSLLPPYLLPLFSSLPSSVPPSQVYSIHSWRLCVIFRHGTFTNWTKCRHLSWQILFLNCKIHSSHDTVFYTKSQFLFQPQKCWVSSTREIPSDICRRELDTCLRTTMVYMKAPCT